MLVSSISSIMQSMSSDREDDRSRVLGIVLDRSVNATHRCGDVRDGLLENSDLNGDVCEDGARDMRADDVIPPEVEGR